MTAFAGGCDCNSSKLSSSRRSVQGDRSPYQKWFTALLRVGAPLALAWLTSPTISACTAVATPHRKSGAGQIKAPRPLLLPPQSPAMARQPLPVTLPESVPALRWSCSVVRFRTSSPKSVTVAEVGCAYQGRSFPLHFRQASGESPLNRGP